MTSITPIDRVHGVAKLENGYSRIANELIEALAWHRISGLQWSVVMVVVRLTYGYQKRTSAIPTKKIADLCNMPPSRAREVIASLLAANVLFRKGGQKGEIGINNHTEQWRFATENVANVSANSATENVANSATENVANSATENVANPADAPYIKKENFKEKEKESENPPPPPPQDFMKTEVPERKVVDAWNAINPDHEVTLTPKLRLRITEVLEFVRENFGRRNWPAHENDIAPWFSDVFQHSREFGEYLPGRDFWFFVSPDRLAQIVAGGYGSHH